MKTIDQGWAITLCFMAFAVSVASAQVTINADTNSHELAYAGKLLQEHLSGINEAGSNYEINLNFDKSVPEEGYALQVDDNSIDIMAADRNGAIYGVYELLEQAKQKGGLVQVQSRTEAPKVGFRAIKFNLPWSAYRSNEAITLHRETVRDIKYWEGFLDMMAENRFNALTLWNHHPYSFMIRAKNFPYACEFDTDAELQEWQDFYHALFQMAADRGIETYLVNWNIYVSENFAKHHNLNGNANVSVEKGVDPKVAELAKQYNKESITQTLNEYTNLTGVGLSLGEAMGGMTAEDRQQWIMDTFIAGIQAADRPAKLIHRVPFSAGLKNGGSTSKMTETITREALESIEGVEEPIWLEAKFNWSHGHSTPKLVKVHGGVLKDTYWNPPTDKFKMNWMIRNEDFFMLRWGVPDFIREHIRLNMNENIGGYYIGSECYIPAKDYMTKLDHDQWQYAYERQWLFYKLWGRLLYNPDTPDETFKNDFILKYGKKAASLLEAYSMASRMPLHYASFIDVNNDKSLYSEGILSRYRRDESEFLNVNLMIDKSSLDPDYLSIKTFVDRLQNNKAIKNGELTPLALADELNALSKRTFGLVQGIEPGNDVALRYEIEDVKVWAKLADYLAEKIRGGVAYYTFQKTKDKSEQKKAIDHLKKALKEWDAVIALTEPIYKTVPLTHFHYRKDNKFHWSKLRDAVKRDIEIVEKDLRKEISVRPHAKKHFQ